MVVRPQAAYEDIQGQRVYYDVHGSRLEVGQKAPDFELVGYDGMTVRLKNFAPGRKLFNVVNSVDTDICDGETCKFDQAQNTPDLPRGVVLCTMSMDLPYALNRFRQSRELQHLLLSAHRSEEFGRAYGALMMPDRLLQRSVFVLDRDDTLLFVKYFADQGVVPDYTDTLAALRS